MKESKNLDVADKAPIEDVDVEIKSTEDISLPVFNTLKVVNIDLVEVARKDTPIGIKCYINNLLRNDDNVIVNITNVYNTSVIARALSWGLGFLHVIHHVKHIRLDFNQEYSTEPLVCVSKSVFQKILDKYTGTCSITIGENKLGLTTNLPSYSLDDDYYKSL